MTVKIGLTLPSFVEDPEIPLARRARGRGRRASTRCSCTTTCGAAIRRTAGPRSSASALLGAVAAETTRIARRHARRARDVAAGGDARQRVRDRAARQRRPAASPGSARATRRAAPRTRRSASSSARWSTGSTRCTTRCARRAGSGFPVWVGGRVAQVREIVAVADGWNSWGAEPDVFAAEVALVREVAPDATLTWGGLARPGEEGAAGLADRLARLRRAGRRVVDHRPGRLEQSRQRSRSSPSVRALLREVAATRRARGCRPSSTRRSARWSST